MGRRRAVHAAALATIIALGAPHKSSGADRRDAVTRLSDLTEQDARAARVGFQLAQANVAFCPVIRYAAGWSLHAASQYSSALRPAAEARFGLEGDLPGVVAVPLGSPGADAGLEPGDLILAVDGVTLDPGADLGVQAWEGYAANLARIDRALTDGAVALTVRREGSVFTVPVRAALSCGYDVQVDPRADLNAAADGSRLFISSAMVAFTTSDDELAIVLGHELAHHVLGHQGWKGEGGAGRWPNGDLPPPDVSRDPEQDADRTGLILAARAGYDPAAGPAFWRRFGAANWRVRWASLHHRSAAVRARQLDAVKLAIDNQRAAGIELSPF